MSKAQSFFSILVSEDNLITPTKKKIKHSIHIIIKIMAKVLSPPDKTRNTSYNLFIISIRFIFSF